MRQKINTSILLLLFVIISFGQQGIGNQNKKGAPEVIDLSQKLSAAEVESFQKQSEFQIKEFYSYLSYLSDPELDEDLKNQIQEVILGEFIDGVGFYGDLLDLKQEDGYSLSGILARVKSKKEKMDFSASDFTIKQKSVNAWVVRYKLTVESKSDTKSFYVDHVCGLYEEEKAFGKEVKTVVEPKLRWFFLAKLTP